LDDYKVVGLLNGYTHKHETTLKTDWKLMKCSLATCQPQVVLQSLPKENFVWRAKATILLVVSQDEISEKNSVKLQTSKRCVLMNHLKLTQSGAGIGSF
jgi:hypothetical protein